MILTLVVGKVDFAGNSLLRIFRTDTEMRRFLFFYGFYFNFLCERDFYGFFAKFVV